MSDSGDRPGKLASLLGSGRIEALLRTGGLEVGAPAHRPGDGPAVLPDRSEELERLFRRDERQASREARPAPPPPTPLEETIALFPRPLPPPRLERVVADAGRETALVWRLPLTDVHGRHRHEEALAVDPADLARALRDERLAAFDVRTALFLDIESTGLSHGAGTHAFLVGLAWFESDALVLEQLFLEDPNDEAALLQRFARRRGACRSLVSFNGRCFDVHVLQARLILNRIYDEEASALHLTPHVDLLHIGRAIHGGCFENNRLQTFERELLGVTRHDDVPGELIPSLYFEYLRTSDTAPLASVLLHNALDVLGMVSLYSHFCLALAGDGVRLPARVGVNLGHLWLGRGVPERAERVLGRVLGSAAEHLPARLLRQALADRTTALKRLLAGGAGEAAPELLRRLRSTLEAHVAAAPDDPVPHGELARLHERHTGDRAAALRHAERALALLSTTASDEERGRAERRVARLARTKRAAPAGGEDPGLPL